MIIIKSQVPVGTFIGLILHPSSVMQELPAHSLQMQSLLISLLGMSDPGPVGPGPDASSRFDQQLPAQVFNAPNSCWICVIGLNTEIVPLPPQLMPTSTTFGKVVIRKTGEPLSPPAFP